MCSRCHTINGRGGALGPDLSNVAQSIDRAQIVQSILRPSDKFPPQYQAWAVTTIDGVSHVGLQLDHQAEGAMELLTTEGKTVRFSVDKIDRYDVLPRSIMPDDLETTMTTRELRHLVAFLESLK
jgi:putative heme-binding domain-containing protein